MEITFYEYQTDAMSMKWYGVDYYARYGDDGNVALCMRKWAVTVIGYLA